MGCQILPSGGRRCTQPIDCLSSYTRNLELPATACPCRIHHVKGKPKPTLTIDQEYFQNAIEKFRSKKLTDNDSLGDSDDQNNFDDLDPTSVENSHKFTQNGYRIPGYACGDDDVKDLVHCILLLLP
jgi:hypothetical protein